MGNAKWLEQRRDSLLEGLENSKSLGFPTKTPSDWKTSPQGIHQHIKTTQDVCRGILRKNMHDAGTSNELLNLKLVAEDIKLIIYKLTRYIPDWESSSDNLFVEIRYDFSILNRTFFALNGSWLFTDN